MIETGGNGAHGPHAQPTSWGVQGASSGGHLFTIASAAEACGLSEMTVKRDLLKRGKFPAARKEPIPGGGGTERWVIPYRDLLAAGYTPNRPRAESRPQSPVEGGSRSTPDPEQVQQLRRLLDDERKWRERAERRAELAEAVAAERERAITLVERSLRQLEPGPSPATRIPATQTPALSKETKRGKTGWFSRRWVPAVGRS